MNQPLLTLLSGIKQLLSKKQDKLTAGENITISEDNVINAVGGGGGDSLWETGGGDKSVQTKGTTSIADGDYSVAEGYNTLTKSDYSHSEGWATRTIVDTDDEETFGHASHAEGSHTIARGAASHAEGNTTESKGMYSHAEGAGSLSGGIASHAEGNGTVTNNQAEHAEGSYNKSNTNSILFGSGGNTLHSIGIGTSMADSKNAFEVMQNGDAYIYGIGGYDGTNPGQTSTVQEALAAKEDKRVIVDGTPNADFSVLTLSYNSEPVTGTDIFDWLQSGKDVVIHILGGEDVYVVLHCAVIEDEPVFYGFALNMPGMPSVMLAFGYAGKDSPYLYASLADIVNKNTAVVEQTAPTSLTLADNTEYYLTNVSDLSITYPSGRFESWIRLTTATSGTVTIELPTSQYIGTAPTFGNGETWEISIKDGVVAAIKVGDGE